MAASFFTFSIGIGVTLLSLMCVWAWKYLFRLNRGFLAVLLGLWAASLAALNWHGLVLMPTLYALLMPLVVGGDFSDAEPQRPGTAFPVDAMAALPGCFTFGPSMVDPDEQQPLYRHQGQSFVIQQPGHRLQRLLLSLHPLPGRGLSQSESKTDQDLSPLKNGRCPGVSKIKRQALRLRLPPHQ